MKRKNPFDGESYRALLAQKCYIRLKGREWFTLADVLADYLGCSSKEELKYNVSKDERYHDLKMGFADVCYYIKELIGEGSIQKEGSTRNVRFRYTGKDNDPLAQLWQARAVKSLGKYWQFCQDSSGFIPKAWFEYFFEDYKDLFDLKVRRSQGDCFVSTSMENEPKNIGFLPFLHEAITGHKVLSIKYKPFGEEERTLICHPHYIKEYNGRWQLLGYVDGKMGYHLSLDRIQEKPLELLEHNYVPAPPHYYEKYFNNIIGLTHSENSKAQDIRIRLHTEYMFGLFVTKPLHHSQTITAPYGEHPDGIYGEISLHIEINKEFVGRILQMGSNVEIISPREVRELFRGEVAKLSKLYGFGG